MSNKKPSTVNNAEIEKFSKMAEDWWNPEGKFKPLHKFNPVRIKFIRDELIKKFGKIKNLEILDIGCGGGLLSVPFARLGANVTGVDAAEKNIKIAKIHAEKEDIKINFVNDTIENLASKKKQYDVIFNMEVIEHVDNVELFLSSCAKILKKDGIMFVATLNRTAKSYIFAIIGAEYVMNWLPKGTHDWNKFLKPSEINYFAEKNSLKLQQISGVKYNAFKDEFSLSDDVSVNYMMVFEN
jgi:2-polyprenyl-6-hydroxyphenyl methylase/3-demethylubiquinone-9 3-methyltransferase